MNFRLAVIWPATFLASLLFSTPVWGHAQFVASDPAADTTLKQSPHEIVLTFSQAVTPVTVTLVGPDGATIEMVGDVAANGERVVLPVTAPLSTGAFLVSYRVLSGDSHSISGGFRFTLDSSLGEEASNPPITASPEPVSTDTGGVAISESGTSVDRAQQWVRLAFVASLLLAAGLVIFRLTIPLPESLDTWNVQLTRIAAGAGLLLVATYFVVSTFAATGIDGFQLRHLYVVLQTSIGVSLSFALLGFVFLVLSGTDERIMSGLGAFALIVSRVLTGHPVSQDPMWLLIPAMAVHVAAAAFWFASLWVMLRMLRAGPLKAAPEIIAAFARTAFWSVGALVVAGSLTAVIHLGSVDALLHTQYGQIVLWKLGGVAGLLLIAAINKWVFTPDFLKRFDTTQLMNSIRFETLLMIAVIGVSTILAATPPAGRAETALAQSIATDVSVPSDSGQFTLNVKFSSSPYDETQPLSVSLVDNAGNPITPLEAEITVTIPSRRIEALPLRIVRREGNHIVVDADFPDASDTQFAALMLVTDFDRERFVFNRDGALER